MSNQAAFIWASRLRVRERIPALIGARGKNPAGKREREKGKRKKAGDVVSQQSAELMHKEKEKREKRDGGPRLGIKTNGPRSTPVECRVGAHSSTQHGTCWMLSKMGLLGMHHCSRDMHPTLGTQ